MKDESIDKYKKAKFGDGFTKETARAKYEQLKNQKQDEPLTQRDNFVDVKIKKAMADGAFDNLPGKGMPLDLNKYSDIPEHLRVAYQMLKNSGFVPEEVRLKKEMGLLQERIAQCESEDEKHELMKQLAEVSQRYNFCMEYNKGFKKTFY